MDSCLTLRFRQPELDFPFHNSLKNQLPVLGSAGPNNNAAPKRAVLVPRGRRSSTHRRRLIVRAEINSPIEGVGDDLNLIASRNLDFAYTRRKVRSAFTQVQLQLDHCLFTMAPSGIRTQEWYERNSKGLEIFCKSWMPKLGDQIKGVLFFCHGYGDTCTFFFEGRTELQGLPCFILGQSMGGAVTIKAHLKEPRAWDGVILVAPMCKIAEEMTPPPALMKVFILLSKILPKAKLIPLKDLADLAFRDSRKKEMAVYNVICYNDQTRLKTAFELLNATIDIEKQVGKVSSPLLILHGAEDKVTDPSVSQFLYEKASSTDKTLKLYEEGYHCILEGEPDDRIFTVISDIISWLDARC
ncbi:caffeoylshikimate esterase isoform X3 [Citrus clementina]|uniref:caffeoylshikimate esterase isoform X3 n=1 Tax=Citrus clementina TaxID=85681 RepID=UPI000CED463F|nr:caffeoylshikimate esterase isoform X3 [Citrus x clementina]